MITYEALAWGDLTIAALTAYLIWRRLRDEQPVAFSLWTLCAMAAFAAFAIFNHAR